MELGIAETNLVGLIRELGAAWSRGGQLLLPIGIPYDPFVERALEPWSYGIYAGGQSILVGIPSGVTLAAEGVAHQSIKTSSIGLEQPGCVSYEPAFSTDVEWTLLACLSRLGRLAAAYLGLSTRPVEQQLAAVPADPADPARRRRQVVAGGSLIRRQREGDHRDDERNGERGTRCRERLTQTGVPADVLCATSPGLLFRTLQAHRGRDSSTTPSTLKFQQHGAGFVVTPSDLSASAAKAAGRPERSPEFASGEPYVCRACMSLHVPARTVPGAGSGTAVRWLIARASTSGRGCPGFRG